MAKQNANEAKVMYRWRVGFITAHIVDMWRPLVAVVIIAAAKEGVRRGNIQSRMGFLNITK